MHSLVDMFRTRMFAICCGYEDADDLDHLRSDRAFMLACAYWVMAYHSFSGDVEASNTHTIRCLTPSRRHKLPRKTLLRWQLRFDHTSFLISHVGLVSGGLANTLLSGGWDPHGNSRGEGGGVRPPWNQVDPNHSTPFKTASKGFAFHSFFEFLNVKQILKN